MILLQYSAVKLSGERFMHRATHTIAAPDKRVIEDLLDPAAFRHPVTWTKLIETHISWVILTDDYAYKIKKPLDLDFLDFSDLERRKFYCDEEIRLNKPSAPDIYLDVVPIIEQDGRLCFDGDGEPVEYAVRMRRFDQKLRLDAQLAEGLLTVGDMKELGQVIAAQHEAAAPVDARRREHQLKITKDFIWDNFTWLDGYVDSECFAFLTAWTAQELGAVSALLGERFDAGFVRECHGDLHLANLVRLPGGITTFDCIEFNADLRNSDVVCDTAFLVMDLVARERHDLASHLLNRYLECSGDYDGVALLDLYFVYRCLVRAKVAAISSQECTDPAERETHLAEAQRYCDMARRQANKRQPVLVVMHGLSGSGKTWIAEKLMAALPAIRIRSDVERKRLSGLPEHADSGSGVAAGIYTAQADENVYAHLCLRAQRILCSDHSVILDAAFLRGAERARALAIGDECGCATSLLQVQAPVELLRKRILERASGRQDASEASLAVLEHQIDNVEPIGENDAGRTIICDNIGDVDIAAIVDKIRAART